MEQQTQVRPDTRSTAQDARTHALLCAGIPLSLLLDLMDPRGPRSQEIYGDEQPGASRLHA